MEVAKRDVSKKNIRNVRFPTSGYQNGNVHMTKKTRLENILYFNPATLKQQPQNPLTRKKIHRSSWTKETSGKCCKAAACVFGAKHETMTQAQGYWCLCPTQSNHSGFIYQVDGAKTTWANGGTSDTCRSGWLHNFTFILFQSIKAVILLKKSQGLC